MLCPPAEENNNGKKIFPFFLRRDLFEPVLHPVVTEKKSSYKNKSNKLKNF